MNMFLTSADLNANQQNARFRFVITPQKTVITNTENLREKPLPRQKTL